MWNKTKQFKQLQSTWYAKLEKSGFEDIEQPNEFLKDYHSYIWVRPKVAINFEEHAEFFRLAGTFLYSYKFESEYDKLVWKMYAEGAVVQEIQAMLKTKRSPNGKGLIVGPKSRTQIYLTIQRLSNLMLKTYDYKPK